MKEKKAVEFKKTAAKDLMKFLNKGEQLPIVSFNIKYDKDKVLKPAFKKLDLDNLEATEARWRCAQELCKRTENWKIWSLDDALEHFGFDRREPDMFHDALDDARLAAKVYMEAIQLPPLKEAKLGFAHE